MGVNDLKEEIQRTNSLVTELIDVTKKTEKTLTWVNIINILTLIALAGMMFFW